MAAYLLSYQHFLLNNCKKGAVLSYNDNSKISYIPKPYLYTPVGCIDNLRKPFSFTCVQSLGDCQSVSGIMKGLHESSDLVSEDGCSSDDILKTLTSFFFTILCCAYSTGFLNIISCVLLCWWIHLFLSPLSGVSLFSSATGSWLL